MYRASIRITLRPSILDPQGKAVHHAAASLGYATVADVRMGKVADVLVDAPDAAAAEAIARELGAKLLANPVMEDFSVAVEPA